jgi:2-haloacid dehalogenase
MRAVAFDAIETCLSLEPLRPKLADMGLRPVDLELWFAQALRDAFAIEVSGGFKPFAEVLEGALEALLASRGLPLDGRRVRELVEAFAELPVHPDVRPAFERVRRAGLKLAIITNGSRKSTHRALAHAGLLSFVDAIISVDDVRRFKPARAVYLHAARKLGVPPWALGVVAAHGWDVHGARAAGLRTVFVERKERLSPALRKPDAIASNLSEAVDALGAGRAAPRRKHLLHVLEIAAAAAVAVVVLRAAR